MQRYNTEILRLTEENEVLLLYLICLAFLFLVLFFRNFYNLLKKRAYRKKFRKLEKQYSATQLKIEQSQKELDALKAQVSDLKQKHKVQINNLSTNLKKQEEELNKREDHLEYQRNAFEKYAGFKIVDANNSRLGAHFLKNVISHIYEDLEDELEEKTSNALSTNLNAQEKALIPIKALKNIFSLLDYTVSVIKRDTVSIKEELSYLNLFLSVIKYLKPKTNFSLKNKLTDDEQKMLKIRPTLFFPFIENALKHGDLNRADSKITIELHASSNDTLTYTVINSCEFDTQNQQAHSQQNNFGLKALRDLLDTYYPNNELEYRPITENMYLSKLVIPYVND